MKGKDPKLEEIQVSHTLGGVVLHIQIRQSDGLSQTMSLWVAIILLLFIYYESIK